MSLCWWSLGDTKFLFSCWKKYFTRSLRSLVKYFSTLEEKFRISARPCNILYISNQNQLFGCTGKTPQQHNFCQGRIWMSSHSFTRSMISPRVRSETWILTKKFWDSRPAKKLENERMEKRLTVFLFQIAVVKSLTLSVFCSQNIQWRKKRIFRTLLCAHCIVVTVR